MEGVRCISSSLVQASSTHRVENQRVELTPWDLRLLLVGPIQKDGVTVSDIVDPVYVPSIVHSFFPLNGLSNYDGISQPLLGVQVTKLTDGVFIGCTINHSVVDGASFWHFINSWSEISKGSIHLSKPPIFRRSFFDNTTEYPIRIPRSSVEKLRGDRFIPPPLVERVFHFSKQNIAKLKAKANAEVRTNISSLQALLSHLWQSIVRNKELSPDKEMSFYLTIGARPRLHDVPERYFGNAAKAGIITMKVNELRERSVGNIALEMHKLVHAHTEEVCNNGDSDICLLAETLEAMANDDEFMDTVTM
ncbi:hypothetical protein like AT3G50300 [Hibiscus trionum]|uniref:Uncharacterized protein n=1 Tax=Hibiscus trionum TaxID=183268 RepID=A0A9W7IVS6_HIBTR|nr:hypothetical protein like AT3G50300 [Hibiscus trionum]